MPRFPFHLVLIAVAGSAMAQSWNLHEMDIPLDMTQLWELTDDSTLIFPDDGESRFSPDGSYLHIFPDHRRAEFGRFSLERGGRICVDLENGRNRCDLFVYNDKLLIMISERGGRFPVRVKFGLKP